MKADISQSSLTILSHFKVISHTTILNLATIKTK